MRGKVAKRLRKAAAKKGPGRPLYQALKRLWKEGKIKKGGLHVSQTDSFSFKLSLFA